MMQSRNPAAYKTGMAVENIMIMKNIEMKTEYLSSISKILPV